MPFIYVARFWENNPNRTSAKIKLTPPMHTHGTSRKPTTFINGTVERGN